MGYTWSQHAVGSLETDRNDRGDQTCLLCFGYFVAQHGGANHDAANIEGWSPRRRIFNVLHLVVVQPILEQEEANGSGMAVCSNTGCWWERRSCRR